MNWVIILYALCCLVSIITLISYGLLFIMKRSILNGLPKVLRLHFILTIFPYSVATTLCTFGCTIVYFLENNEANPRYETLRFILTGTSQMLRIAFVLIVLERIIATIYLEKYSKFSSGFTVFYLLTFISYFTTFLYLIPALSWIVSPVLRVIYKNMIYFVVGMHFFTMIVCKHLHHKNKLMYRLLAYRGSLQRRCQILENIKVTTALWDPILLFSIVAPMGLILKTILSAWAFELPFSFNHFFYNLSFVFAIAQKYFKSRQSKTVLLKAAKTVLNPMGKALPANVSTDNYFAGLKRQWG